MKKNTMSLKATINNIAKENKVSAQSVLQTYMLERLLERISVSQYKDNFILKGGMLISAMLGIDSRTTMDIDTTIKGFELTEENVKKIMEDVCKIDLHDDITLKINRVEEIRENDYYNGYRLTFEEKYMNNMPVIMKIDVTTGDKITYREIEYSFELMLENRKINIWSYNVETVLAEKFEAIIKRGVLGTRIREFYDVHMLLKTQIKNVDKKTLRVAIMYTAEHRGSLDIMKQWKEIVEELKDDETMISQWKRYKKNNFYAEGIDYKDLIDSIIVIGEIWDGNFEGGEVELDNSKLCLV